MSNFAQEIIQMVRDMERITALNEIASKQFLLAAETDDKEKMEAARLECHEYLDQILDVRLRLARAKNTNLEELIAKMRKFPE